MNHHGESDIFRLNKLSVDIEFVCLIFLSFTFQLEWCLCVYFFSVDLIFELHMQQLSQIYAKVAVLSMVVPAIQY